MFIKWFDIIRLRNVYLISIVLTKSFNLIPMSKKKVRNFFSRYGFFLQCLYGFLIKSYVNAGVSYTVDCLDNQVDQVDDYTNHSYKKNRLDSQKY